MRVQDVKGVDEAAGHDHDVPRVLAKDRLVARRHRDAGRAKQLGVLAHAQRRRPLHVGLELFGAHRLAKEQRRPYQRRRPGDLRGARRRGVVLEREERIRVDGDRAALCEICILPKVLEERVAALVLVVLDEQLVESGPLVFEKLLRELLCPPKLWTRQQWLGRAQEIFDGVVQACDGQARQAVLPLQHHANLPLAQKLRSTCMSVAR